MIHQIGIVCWSCSVDLSLIPDATRTSETTMSSSDRRKHESSSSSRRHRDDDNDLDHRRSKTSSSSRRRSPTSSTSGRHEDRHRSRSPRSSGSRRETDDRRRTRSRSRTPKRSSCSETSRCRDSEVPESCFKLPPTDEKIVPGKDGFYRCVVCDVKVESRSIFLSHMNSKDHIRFLAKLRSGERFPLPLFLLS